MANGREGNDIKRDFDNVKQGVGMVRDDVTNMAHHAKDAASEGMSHVKDRVRGAVGELKHRGEEMTEKVRGQVAENPMKTVIIALGVGLFVGMLLARPWHSRD